MSISENDDDSYYQKTSLHFEKLVVKDWQSHPINTEKYRFVYRASELSGLRQKVENIKRDYEMKQVMKGTASPTPSWFAIRASVPLTTVFLEKSLTPLTNAVISVPALCDFDPDIDCIN